MTNLLFIAESYTTAIRLIPVYLEARRGSEFNPTFFTTSPPNEALQLLLAEHGVDYITHQDIFAQEDLARLDAMKRDYAAVFASEFARADASGFAYQGVPLADMFKDYILSWNQDKIGFMYIFDKLVERCRPDMLIVAYCSGGAKKYYVNRASQLGIKTLNVQYAYRSNNIAMVQKRMNCDYYCIWGQLQLEPFIFEEKHRPNTFLTGNPTFDIHDYDQAEARRRLGVEDAGRVFSVGIHLYPEPMDRFAREIAEARLAGDETFIIQMHPDLYSHRDEARAVMESLGLKHRIACADVSAYTVLKASDYYIALEQETLFVEAYYFAPKIILLPDENGRRPDLLYDCLEGTYIDLPHLRDLERLPELEQKVDQDRLQKARELLWHKPDHQASRRILQTAAQVLADNR